MLRPRILVIDDDPHLVRVVSMYLQVEGYEVVTARDGEEGLRDLEVNGADLVVLDVMMAGMDGVSTCRAIKGDPRFQHIPVIMFTALDREADEELGRAVGADRYLAKPFSLVGLGEVIRGHIEGIAEPVDIGP